MLRFRFRLFSEIISDGLFTSAPTKPQTCGKEPASLFNTDGLSAWLRAKFPNSTAFHVEAETGIPAASVENWLQMRSRPSVEHFATLCWTFGPALMVACFRKKARWIETAAQTERVRELDEQIARLAEERERMKDVA